MRTQRAAMRTCRDSRTLLLLFGCAISALSPMHAYAAGSVDTGAAPTPAAASPATPAAAATPPIILGLEDFSGVSNLDTKKQYSDGMWIGNAPAYPSVVYARWDNGKGTTARVSLGIGSEFTGSTKVVDQPVEAWIQAPVGKASLTAGKFYVPFGLQEWEYETKPGLMLNWSRGADSIWASVNYNHKTQTANSYLRYCRAVTPNAALGASIGNGKGFSYDNDYDKGYGVDGMLTFGGWQLLSEYEVYRNPSANRFYFGYGKLSYTNLGRWKPSVGYYRWSDQSPNFGAYNGLSYMLGYQISPNFTLQGGYAPNAAANAASQGVEWLEMHTTWEK